MNPEDTNKPVYSYDPPEDDDSNVEPPQPLPKMKKSPHIIDARPKKVSQGLRGTPVSQSVRRGSTQTNKPEPPRWLVLSLQILAYGIPLSFLAYVLYINYLPFGYDKTFIIDVGAEGDTDSSQVFYLEPSPDLSERKVAADGTTYRELNGIAYAIFKPDVVLKDAEITVSVEGEGVSIIPPVIDFDPNTVEWDYEWDFTNPDTAFTAKTSERARAEWLQCTTTEMGTGSISEGNEEFVPVPISVSSSTATPTEVCEQSPVPDLDGNAFFFDDALTFNGHNTHLELNDSENKFEDGQFMIYIEWTPKDSEHDMQQIVGHFNWEIFQNSNSVEFRVGRMNDEQGPPVILRHSIDSVFFNNKHSALAIYKPGNSGYVELYIDSNLVRREYFGSMKIWNQYGFDNVTLGKSRHGNSNFFEGSVSSLKFNNTHIELDLHNENYTQRINSSETVYLPLTADTGSSLIGISHQVTQY